MGMGSVERKTGHAPVLTERMKRFADEWLTGKETGKKFNASAAARLAYTCSTDNSASVHGAKLLRHPEVRKYIDIRLKGSVMSTTEVLARFADLARGDIGEIVTQDAYGRLALDVQEVLKRKHLIKGFSFDSNNNPKVEFHDPAQALRDMAKLLGMMKDGLEISGPGGGAVPVAMTVRFVSPAGREVGEVPPPALESGEEEVETEDFSDL